MFARHSSQSESLQQMSWQIAPLWVGDLDAALREPFGDPRGEREAAELLQRMLAVGLSKFEPDPLHTLDRTSPSVPLRERTPAQRGDIRGSRTARARERRVPPRRAEE